jgi:hypothetical protein
VNAYVNHGRWLVACAGDCYAVLLVTGTEMVCECSDTAVCDHPKTPCGAAFTVVIPDDAAEITAMLNRRPKRTTRNWTPSETLHTLKAENLSRGVGL